MPEATSLEPCGRSLSRIAEIDDSQRMPELKECSFTVMCDVDAAFYGPKGAAWLFGPQKGATNKILEALDDGMRTFAAVVKKIWQVDAKPELCGRSRRNWRCVVGYARRQSDTGHLRDAEGYKF